MAGLPAVTSSSYSAIHDTLLLRLSSTTLGEESLQSILLELMDEVTSATSGVKTDRLMLANSSTHILQDNTVVIHSGGHHVY